METLITLLKDVNNIVNMIIPKDRLNYYVAILYHNMKRTYRNYDIEDYIDYHDIQYILHITTIYQGFTDF